MVRLKAGSRFEGIRFGKSPAIPVATTSSTLAQEAMITLWDVYGLEALVLAPH